jgi:hypothetical protein
MRAAAEDQAFVDSIAYQACASPQWGQVTLVVTAAANM